MNTRGWRIWCGAIVAGMGYLALLAGAEPLQVKPKEVLPVSVAMARERASLMHEIYTTTLDVMHHRYFRSERTIVPARAMEDVFTEMRRTTKTEVRWIAVNLKAMSLNHEPGTEFEKRAAREIADGKNDVEVVEEGYYRRAGAIPLGVGCIGCHEGVFRLPSKEPKFAALVISIPVSKLSK